MTRQLELLTVLFCLFLGSISQGLPLSESALSFHKNWVRKTTLEGRATKGIHHMSPVFYQNLVIQGNGVDGIVAYDRRSGSQVWRKNVAGGVEGGGVVSEDRLYFSANDGLFYCLIASTGEVVWSFLTRAEGFSAPLIEGGTVYFQSSARVLYALDKKTGKKRWVYARKDPSFFSIRGSSSPTIWGAQLFIGFSDGYLLALNKETGDVIWEKSLGSQNKFRDIDAKPLLEGGFVYVGGFDGSLYKLKASSGATVWKIHRGIYSPPVLSGELIYVVSNEGSVLSANKKTGKINWEVKTKGGLLTSPVLFKSFLLVGSSQRGLLLMDKTNGALRGSFSPGLGLVATPALKGGSVYLMSNGGNLFSLKLLHKKKSAGR